MKDEVTRIHARMDDLEFMIEELRRRVKITQMGSFLLEDAETSKAVTLGVLEKDTSYSVLFAVVAATAGSVFGDVTIGSQTVTGFTATTTAAPGAGKQITYDYLIVRTP